MDLSIVLPCYNEEQNVATTVRDVADWMRARAIDGEIVAVDDGSTDATFARLEELRAQVPQLRIVHLQQNGGYGIAVRAGCDAAQREWIAFMDSDGQFRAADLERLFPATEQVAFVTGRRRRRADPLIRSIYGKVLGVFTWLTLGLWVRDINCGMKMFRRSVWPQIRPEHGVEKLFNAEVFLRLQRRGIPWAQVDVPHYPRRAGTPTGASVRVIIRMFQEMKNLRSAMKTF